MKENSTTIVFSEAKPTRPFYFLGRGREAEKGGFFFFFFFLWGYEKKSGVKKSLFRN